jgi:hypothetical protein
MRLSTDIESNSGTEPKSTVSIEKDDDRPFKPRDSSTIRTTFRVIFKSNSSYNF